LDDDAIDAGLEQVARERPDLADAARTLIGQRPLREELRQLEAEDAKLKLAQIAATAERDIDDGTIKLTSGAADRELARLAELKHAGAASFGEQPGDLSDLVQGLLGFGHDGRDLSEREQKAAQRYFHDSGGPNGAELGQLVTCPRCDQRMTRRGVRGVDTPDEWVCQCGLSCTAEGARSEHVRAGFAASKRHAAEAATVPNEKEQAALAFCFRAAAGDSGGQRRVRQFLFAWHNATELGGFDFADLWSLDERHLAAVLTLINMIARGETGHYPHHYGYEADMEALIETYGPESLAPELTERIRR
jgi:hypothetical protein